MALFTADKRRNPDISLTKHRTAAKKRGKGKKEEGEEKKRKKKRRKTISFPPTTGSLDGGRREIEAQEGPRGVKERKKRKRGGGKGRGRRKKRGGKFQL